MPNSPKTLAAIDFQPDCLDFPERFFLDLSRAERDKVIAECDHLRRLMLSQILRSQIATSTKRQGAHDGY